MARKEHRVDISRRRWLAAMSGLGSLLLLGQPGRVWAHWKPKADPFTLGVASGNPTPNGMVLWTRLAPEPLAPGGGMPAESVPVQWEIAEDENFSRSARSGTAYAIAAEGHSVHVEFADLPANRVWYYRFRVGDAISAVGRTKTAPQADAAVDQLRLALASCAHYEHGMFAAYREIGEADLDFVLHVGDYIYENTWGERIRRFGAPEPMTLEDYRQRHALYKLDPDLQLAHASHPWLITWDDHDVDNDYAGAISQDRDPQAAFLHRRAAAYQAFYEHLPLSRSQVMQGPWMRLYGLSNWGQLADLHLLDCRQYRTVQPCRPPGRGSSNEVGCQARLDPTASMLGADQEQWFYDSLLNSQRRWNLIGQSTLFASKDGDPGPEQKYWTDGWDGYAANRQRMLGPISQKRNPVLLGGDMHAHYVANVHADGSDAPVASEICGTSISSQGWPQEMIAAELPANPHILLGDGERRGYVAIDVTNDRLSADLRVFDSIVKPDAISRSLSKFTVAEGNPGLQRG